MEHGDVLSGDLSDSFIAKAQSIGDFPAGVVKAAVRVAGCVVPWREVLVQLNPVVVDGCVLA